MTRRLNCVDSSKKKKPPRGLTYGILIFAYYFGIFFSFAQLETQNKESAVFFFVNVISYWHSQDTLNTAILKIYRNTLKKPVNNYYLLKETTSNPHVQMRDSNYSAQKLAYWRKSWRQRRRTRSYLDTQSPPCLGCKSLPGSRVWLLGPGMEAVVMTVGFPARLSGDTWWISLLGLL